MIHQPGLILKLRQGYKVEIGDHIVLTVEKIQSSYEVKLRIEAPQEIHIVWDKPDGLKKTPRTPSE